MQQNGRNDIPAAIGDRRTNSDRRHTDDRTEFPADFHLSLKYLFNDGFSIFRKFAYRQRTFHMGRFNRPCLFIHQPHFTHGNIVNKAKIAAIAAGSAGTGAFSMTVSL